MSKNIDKIISDFQKSFVPPELPVAENMFSRFMAGETIYALTVDYPRKTGTDVSRALRFFILHTRRNKRAIELYNDWQKKRFE